MDNTAALNYMKSRVRSCLRQAIDAQKRYRDIVPHAARCLVQRDIGWALGACDGLFALGAPRLALAMEKRTRKVERLLGGEEWS